MDNLPLFDDDEVDDGEIDLNLFLFDDDDEIDDGEIDLNIIGEIVNDLAQPLNIINNNERRNVPKNEGFYETTIPLYMGDLFREHFRMSRAAFEELSNVVGNEILQLREKIPLNKKLLFTIWVLSKPESFLASGDRFGLARSTAHNVFSEIVVVLHNLIANYITWLINYNAIEEAFLDRFRIPGIVGAIDGCHIEIKQPTDNANDYYNRNNYHSIILQEKCDYNMKFLNVYIGIPGRVHDARVFRNSPVFAQIHAMPVNLHVLGDSAYALSMNVMTPFRDNGHLNETETNYNINHSSARAVVERAFGRLKGKFISAACVLHNFIITQDGENDEEFEADVGNVNEDYDDEAGVFRNRDMAVEKRMQIAELLLQ